MMLDRREFLALATVGVAGHGCLSRQAALAVGPQPLKAVAFDAFPIFDPRPVSARAEAIFPGKGMDLTNAWRTRQFEYQWLRTMAGRHADFWTITEDALSYAATLLHLELTPPKRDRLMRAYLELKAWPDVQASLRSLREAGIRLALLSNMTTKMLDAGIGNAGLEGVFEHVLSTDRVRAFKPDPRAYRMAVDAFQIEREAILFAAFAGWDAAGAKWFGYPTFWVNRLDVPGEELGAPPDGMGRDLTDLLSFVEARRADGGGTREH